MKSLQLYNYFMHDHDHVVLTMHMANYTHVQYSLIYSWFSERIYTTLAPLKVQT